MSNKRVRTALLLTLTAILCGLPDQSGTPRAATQFAWPAWQHYKQTLMSEDGRVIDRSSAQLISTSEGQAYALFFALLANDQAAFTRLLRWTQNNLAGGDLNRQLPAWKWGQARDGQ
jgi:endoglucanase